MRHYGIPKDFVRVILNMHEGTSCTVMVDGCLSDPLEVKSGVMQGGILSPYCLFGHRLHYEEG